MLCDHLLPSLGCDDYSIAPLRAFLDAYGRLPGHHTGLPIGQEAASVLGTAYMSSLDRAVSEFNCIRWVDDWLLAGSNEGEFWVWLGALDDQAQRIGMSLNEAKSGWASWGESLDSDDSLAFLLEEPEVSDPYAWLLVAATTGGIQGVSRCLGQLGSRTDHRGVQVARGAPWLLERLPRSFARYAKAVFRRLPEDEKEWLVEMAVGLGDEQAPPPVRLHLLHSLRSKLSRFTEPSVLFAEGVRTLASVDQRPVACELFAAAARGGNRGLLSDAIDLAFDHNDLNLQRGLLGELRPGNVSRAQRRAVEELARRSPGLAPLSLALAA